jgi:hypothetical protein
MRVPGRVQMIRPRASSSRKDAPSPWGSLIPKVRAVSRVNVREPLRPPWYCAAMATSTLNGRLGKVRTASLVRTSQGTSANGPSVRVLRRRVTAHASLARRLGVSFARDLQFAVHSAVLPPRSAADSFSAAASSIWPTNTRSGMSRFRAINLAEVTSSKTTRKGLPTMV